MSVAMKKPGLYDGARPLRYKVLTINLANARTNKEYAFPGYNLAVLKYTSGATDCDLRLNHVNGDAIDLLNTKRIESHFLRFYITNTAQAGKTLTLIVGEENFKLVPA